MTHDPAAAVREAQASSEFLRELDAARAAHASADGYRALTDAEVEALKRLGNGAADWGAVRVAEGFKPSRVIGCWLQGNVKLGVFEKDVELAPGLSIGSGVFNSDLMNVTVGDHAHVNGVRVLANAYVGPGAAIQNCGIVACAGGTCFGNGIELPVVIETGGRETRVYAELTIQTAAAVAGNRKDKDALARYNAAVDGYCAQARSAIMVVGAGARILNTPKVLNVFAGPGAEIDGAQHVENATLLSEPGEAARLAGGCYVKNAIVQWGAAVDTMAQAVNCVLCEHSHVERHGKLTDSILGPNSVVGGGECTASLCGPFVGLHHQSLLIAAYWPQGRGNIASGANVGSNHTSRAPDQEIWAGEGTFFGLGCNIKFPTDFSHAPYTILVSGVSTLPQRVEMPFSLINTQALPVKGLSTAINEIFPGWVLGENIYMLRRNEAKYARRNKARRNTFDLEVFRPEIMDMVVEARRRLALAEGKAHMQGDGGMPIYTEQDVKGLGKNFMQEFARVAGIKSYTFCLRYYALSGFKRELLRGAKAADLLEGRAAGDRWAHERHLLQMEYAELNPKHLLGELASKLEQIAVETEESKRKDDQRGARVIRDYADAHILAKDDAFVKETCEFMRRECIEIEALLARL
ncbi:MAG: DUF4954 family protein [Planctomycetota bacterium]|nr:DUF4954 family protein [Planctomycetota bacterium]